jgi:chromosome segregation ATPase
MTTLFDRDMSKYGRVSMVDNPDYYTGWDLLAIVMEVSDTLEAEPSRGYDAPKAHHVLRKTKVSYIMGQLKDETLAQLSASCSEAHQAAAAVEQQRAELAREVAQLKDKVAQLKKRLVEADKQLRAAGSRSAELRDSNHKLERDLGKLREFFGLAKVKEALGE